MAETEIVKSSGKDQQKLLSQRAENIFVGGVNSPVRAMASVGMQPLFIQQGKGPRVWDAYNKSYIDYLLSFGALILGHGCLPVEEAIKKVAEKGWHFGMTTPEEIELAEIIQKAIPFIDKIRFVNSGTEAVMGAVRLARGATNRNKIIKFKHAYHGHADYFLVDGGSGLATLKIPLSKGVPKEFYEQTIIADYGDHGGIKNIFNQIGKDIAAVIVEPVGGNYGVNPPDEKFLNYLREITGQYGSLLIFDEVITGFRFGYGSVADLMDIKPDLICLGKIIGGGLPVGAYGGSKTVMNHLAPAGNVYQASTFAGNPLVMAAGKATLKELEVSRREYSRLARYGYELSETFKKSATDNNVELSVKNYRSMFSVKFRDTGKFQKFYQNVFARGVLFAPSEYEVNFISFAHSNEIIEKTKEVITEAMASL